ncbi:response regulator [Alcanivorax sp. 1008]|uniref:response regulator n=1 Tax=Alcanivorax sp. 1008 TaxID=2816853 RepID=UPI001E09930C|nr:response regulator [Alcanivorax sp. 1008]MCC1497118.1 response regulator [Alcanivorax sp. 1008]
MNVLIVEDNKPVSLLLSRIVEEAGLGYVIAADGEAALRLFSQRDIRMAIIDVELPGLDGYQVARDIRNQSPSLPLLIISGNSGESWRQQAFDAGADQFLAKPVRPSELTALLHRYCSMPASS